MTAACKSYCSMQDFALGFDCVPHSRSNFLHFHGVLVIFRQIIAWRLFKGWCPTQSGKSWIHCWLWLRILLKNLTVNSDILQKSLAGDDSARFG